MAGELRIGVNGSVNEIVIFCWRPEAGWKLDSLINRYLSGCEWCEWPAGSVCPRFCNRAERTDGCTRWPIRARNMTISLTDPFRSQSPRCPEAHRRGQPLQSEARGAKNAPESAICGVLPNGPARTGSVSWLVPISNPRSAPRRVGRTNIPSDALRLWGSPPPCGSPPPHPFRMCPWCSDEVRVSQQLARRDGHFLHAGNNPERANAAQAPAPLGANLRF